MTGDQVPRKRPVTRSELVRDLGSLGVRAGAILMVHTRMSAIGWVVGGAETVVRSSLLDALGPEGTLMAYAGWEENPYHLAEWPEEWQRAYLEELPAFDPRLSVGAVAVKPNRVHTLPRVRKSG